MIIGLEYGTASQTSAENCNGDERSGWGFSIELDHFSAYLGNDRFCYWRNNSVDVFWMSNFSSCWSFCQFFFRSVREKRVLERLQNSCRDWEFWDFRVGHEVQRQGEITGPGTFGRRAVGPRYSPHKGIRVCNFIGWLYFTAVESNRLEFIY